MRGLSGLFRFLQSSIGAKVVMAVTGLMLGGFVVGHLTGNLLLFGGQDAINSYAEWLHDNPQLTWAARSGLLVAFLLHVRTGILLQRANRAARPVAYAHESTVQASAASRSMLLTGLLLLAYILLHLAHFTFGWIDAESHALTETVMRGGESVTRPDVYGMVLASFGSIPFALLYIVSMVLLGMHLSHGFHSLFQSLGLRHPSYTPLVERGARAFAWVLAAGYIALPIAVQAGLIS